jgi:hypothetical protein
MLKLNMGYGIQQQNFQIMDFFSNLIIHPFSIISLSPEKDSRKAFEIFLLRRSFQSTLNESFLSFTVVF